MTEQNLKHVFEFRIPNTSRTLNRSLNQPPLVDAVSVTVSIPIPTVETDGTDVTNRVAGPEDGQVGTASVVNSVFCDDIGQNFYRQGDVEKAYDYYHKSLRMQINLLGANDDTDKHVVLSASLLELGQICLTLKKRVEARNHCHESLRIQRSLYSDSHDSNDYTVKHPGICASLYGLGQVCYSLGDYHGSLYLLEASMVMSQECLGHEHPETLKVTNDLNLMKQEYLKNKATKSTLLSGSKGIQGLKGDTGGVCCNLACLTSGATALCGNCGNVRYCSKKCQEECWKTHKNSCKARGKVRTDNILQGTDKVRMRVNTLAKLLDGTYTVSGCADITTGNVRTNILQGTDKLRREGYIERIKVKWSI